MAEVVTETALLMFAAADEILQHGLTWANVQQKHRDEWMRLADIAVRYVRRKALEDAAARVRSAAHGRGFLAQTGTELLIVTDELSALAAWEVGRA